MSRKWDISYQPGPRLDAVECDIKSGSPLIAPEGLYSETLEAVERYLLTVSFAGFSKPYSMTKALVRIC